jgi:hypothetical protein
VTIEALPGSTLPDELRAAGYDVREIGQGERILPAAIVELRLKEGSTVVKHAGIARVMRWAISTAS